MDASLVLPIILNVDYYKCIPDSFTAQLGECDEFLKDVLGSNKVEHLLELIHHIEEESNEKKNRERERERERKSKEGKNKNEEKVVIKKEDFYANKLTIHDKYMKCIEEPNCPTGKNCPQRPIEVLYLKVLSVLKDFQDEFDENSTRDLFDNKSNQKLRPHIQFINKLTENIADKMIGSTNLVCKNYLENTQEGFIGGLKDNQTNKIMKAVLFALLFYILGSKQVQGILKKILKNVYKTHTSEHLLIVSMIVFAILYYVINLFI